MKRILLIAALILTVIGAPACSIKSGPTPKGAAAGKIFSERCHDAGEKIRRTAEGVDGIFIMKLRSEKINFGDQFLLDDPYGSDLLGQGYIISFLREHHAIKRTSPSVTKAQLLRSRVTGYRFVEAIDVNDGKRYRYSGHVEEPWVENKAYLKGYLRFVLDINPARGSPPRYGVTYADISTRDERELWIAGSSLKVIDLQTNEVMAERIGYMFDPAQGSTAGGRAPWLMAASYACPSFGTSHAFSSQSEQAVRFVEKVLHPMSGK